MSDFPPTLSAEQAASRNGTVTGQRTVMTRFGVKPILTLTEQDGTTVDVWATPFMTKQLNNGEAKLPARIEAFQSTKYGRTGYKLVSL
jgi:hypothetical protein